MLSSRRLILLGIIIGLAVLAAIARAVQVQVVDSPKYAAAAEFQQRIEDRTQPPRGTIFDRNGNVLAVSNRGFLVRVNTDVLTDTQAIAIALGPVMVKPTEEIRQKLDGILAATRAQTYTNTLIAFNLSPQATFQLTQTLQTINRGGLTIEPTWKRDYPHGPVAGPTLGFVSLQPVGYSGVEGFYNRELNSQIGLREARSRMDVKTITPTHNGADVVLTLDLTLQSYVENRLAQAIQDTRAISGAIIVMETRTGAILASASSPGYDPNRALDLANTDAISVLRDPAVSDPYEPGSVIKLATMAAALEAGQITTATIMTDTGRLVINGKTIRNSDRSRYGQVDMEDILASSLNVPTAQLALDMGPERLYEKFKLFGFGSRSGIDLGDEMAGILRIPSDVDWSKTDLVTNSYGQGMSATPYQVINAINAIANDGVLMQPYIVKEWREEDGDIVHKQPVPVARVISPQTARTLRDVMVTATRRGTPKALIKGYTVAGKTGTADWYLRGVLQETTIVTYVGFLPADNPQLTILVKLDQPRSSRWAAATTVPVFRDVAERACQVMGVPPNVTQ
jgi:cell division protein FtsI (penicillin-binding protein 3)